MKTIGEVAELAGVTVRTLHHYDELGLLSPSNRSEAGYRLYSYADLARLQEILIWRQLGFPLSEIRGLLDDPGYDRIGALERQRELVDREVERLSALAGAIDAALEAERKGKPLQEATMFEGFDPAQYEDEARERWGHTEAYQQSTRRVQSYADAEWAAIRDEREAAGLARYVRDAIVANAEAAAGGTPVGR
jgi:MerR family transcriptional regulator, thiopeptide resistance regulator